MNVVACLVTLCLVGTAFAGQKCSGHPRMYNGKKCASTTHYADYHKGACGCGPDNGDSQVAWNHNGYVAAANQALFDSGGAKWCGQNCGRCVKLTTTGGYVDGQGSAPHAGVTKVFMISNLCPNEYPNLSWCSQAPGHDTNQYGYGWHFDLENGANQITGGLHWNNPEVTWEFTNCDSAHSPTPSSHNYHSDCYCGKHGKRQVDGNATVV